MQEGGTYIDVQKNKSDTYTAMPVNNKFVDILKMSTQYKMTLFQSKIHMMSDERSRHCIYVTM